MTVRDIQTREGFPPPERLLDFRARAPAAAQEAYPARPIRLVVWSAKSSRSTRRCPKPKAAMRAWDFRIVFLDFIGALLLWRWRRR